MEYTLINTSVPPPEESNDAFTNSDKDTAPARGEESHRPHHTVTFAEPAIEKSEESTVPNGSVETSANASSRDPEAQDERSSASGEDGVSATDQKEGSPINSTMEQDAPNGGGKLRRDSIGSAQDLVSRGDAGGVVASDAAVRAPKGGAGDGVDEVDWDKLSQFSLYMRSDARYYFQHPYARLGVAALVTLCNFLIYAEDPVAHSLSECYIPVVGQAFSFVVNRYPPGGFSALKVFIWLIGLVVGLVVGKLVIHKLLLNRLARLKMFADDMGSFMMMFVTTIVSLFLFSWLYNLFLLAGGDWTIPYRLNSEMGFTNATFMRVAGCGTWLGDFFTLWMVFDMMLQDRLYPQWARPLRKWWKGKSYRRIVLFWSVLFILTMLVIIAIGTDWIDWDKLNRNFLPTNEVSRSFLASFILVMDLFIIMQDWDFPHFVSAIDIKLPGINTSHIKITIPQVLKRLEKITVHITGKWFNYGIIFLVMILDLNMWKNQIFYTPAEYGQYSHPDNHQIYTVRNLEQLATGNETILSYEWRANTTDPKTNHTYLMGDLQINAKYVGYSLGVKAIAFLPSLIAIVVFIALIFIYGRLKPTKKDPYAGRLMRRPKKQKTEGRAAAFAGVVRAKIWGGRQKAAVGKGKVSAAVFTTGNRGGGDGEVNNGVTAISFNKTDGD